MRSTLQQRDESVAFLDGGSGGFCKAACGGLLNVARFAFAEAVPVGAVVRVLLLGWLVSEMRLFFPEACCSASAGLMNRPLGELLLAKVANVRLGAVGVEGSSSQSDDLLPSLSLLLLDSLLVIRWYDGG